MFIKFKTPSGFNVSVRNLSNGRILFLLSKPNTSYREQFAWREDFPPETNELKKEVIKMYLRSH